MVHWNLAQIYEKYGFQLYRRALYLLGNEPDARDACQDVFVLLLRKLQTFRGEAELYTWLYRIVTNRCLNLLRRRGYHVRALGIVRQQHDGPGSPGGGLQAEHRCALLEVLGHFDRQTQELAVYRHLEGMTLEEIAVLTGISRKTIGKKLAALGKKCQHLLQMLGGPDQEVDENDNEAGRKT